MMTSDRLLQITTQGGCGLITRILLSRIPDSVPMVRFDKDDNPVHACVSVPGHGFINFGSDHGMVEVSVDEFRKLYSQFDVDRVHLKYREVLDIINEILTEMR